MKLIRARCWAQSGPSQRAVQCSVQPKWNIDILSQNAASRTQFFQVQAIKTGHISIIYRQNSDILSVSSKGTAVARWRIKISRYLCKYCCILLLLRYWLQVFTVTLWKHLKGNKILGLLIFLLDSRSPKTYGPRRCKVHEWFKSSGWIMLFVSIKSFAYSKFFVCSFNLWTRWKFCLKQSVCQSVMNCQE